MTTRAISENETFESVNFSGKKLSVAEYDQCAFVNCTLTEADVSGFVFIDCEFKNCDLTMARIKNASFRNVKFIGCKMLGLKFDESNPMLLSVSFDNCTLNLSSFYRLKLKQTAFVNCSLHEVDFGQCDLTKSDFSNSDLNAAIFENTILEGANFITASNFAIDPDNNYLKKARFSNGNLAGLLSKYGIIID